MDGLINIACGVGEGALALGLTVAAAAALGLVFGRAGAALSDWMGR